MVKEVQVIVPVNKLTLSEPIKVGPFSIEPLHKMRDDYYVSEHPLGHELYRVAQHIKENYGVNFFAFSWGCNLQCYPPGWS